MKKILVIAMLLLSAIVSINGQELIKYQVAQYPDGKEELT